MGRPFYKDDADMDSYRDPSNPSGYPFDWNERSAAFREKRGYICDECRVDCSTYPRLTDAHHKNGDKSNCEYSNLQCLCKFHHSEKHSHYKQMLKGSEKFNEDMELLQRLWKEQNIPIDKRG